MLPRFEGRIKGGCILLSVHADDSKWITKAKTILETNGAGDIASTGETKGDYGNSDRPKDRVHGEFPNCPELQSF